MKRDCIAVQACQQKVGYLFLPDALDNDKRIGQTIVTAPLDSGESVEESVPLSHSPLFQSCILSPQKGLQVFAMPEDTITVSKEEVVVSSEMAPAIAKKEVLKEEDIPGISVPSGSSDATTLEIYVVRVVFGPEHDRRLKLDLPDLQRHLRDQIERAASRLGEAAAGEREAILDIDAVDGSGPEPQLLPALQETFPIHPADQAKEPEAPSDDIIVRIPINEILSHLFVI